MFYWPPLVAVPAPAPPMVLELLAPPPGALELPVPKPVTVVAGTPGPFSAPVPALSEPPDPAVGLSRLQAVRATAAAKPMIIVRIFIF